jgi:1,2-diacylglycerol 3-alpha-glucosyltransferase
MRIAIFTDDYLPRESGVITSLLSLRRGLIERGHEVYIVAPKYRGYQDELEGVIRLPSINPLIFHKTRAAIPFRRHTKILRDLKPDVIHSMTQYNVGLYADYTAKKLGCPHITTSHTIFAELLRHYPGTVITGYLFYVRMYEYYFRQLTPIALPEKPNLNKLPQPNLNLFKKQIWNMQNVFLNRADHVISPTQHMLDTMCGNGLTAPSSVISNGIDVDFFKTERTRPFLSDGTLRVVTVGRLSSEKRQDTLIRAVAQAPNAHLTIVGDGPQRESWEALAKKLKVLNTQVTFTGSQNHAQIRTILSSADLFVLASYNFDTQGVVLLEAAASGVPVAFCDPKLQESADPGASYLVGKEVADFAELFTHLTDPSELIQKSHVAKKSVGPYDYKVYAEQAEELYVSLLRR